MGRKADTWASVAAGATITLVPEEFPIGEPGRHRAGDRGRDREATRIGLRATAWPWWPRPAEKIDIQELAPHRRRRDRLDPHGHISPTILLAALITARPALVLAAGEQLPMVGVAACYELRCARPILDIDYTATPRYEAVSFDVGPTDERLRVDS
jgi:hypothetical protein